MYFGNHYVSCLDFSCLYNEYKNSLWNRCAFIYSSFSRIIVKPIVFLFYFTALGLAITKIFVHISQGPEQFLLYLGVYSCNLENN